ncbi:rhomboid family intramembrane serine protease [Chryseobacterium sp. 6424]|uniref:rhomboid family intramembrane serine protease n=1 Tax=Chryseobacterium sp. 6424 TaxID=2039166 RepID=UPI000EFB5EFF|nr:rhomboid family intramembrane serine protease [Chryseobacterium sp. 6424]AYO58720.1 rhomboid family intramembrane serine protease [Chryseobacterium sp. 6424]
MFPKLTPITKNIIILCVAVYVLANFFFPQMYYLMSAYYPFSPNFRSWQIVTHMFMHAGIGEGVGLTHILFNMLTLWSFGPALEQTLDSRRYTILYFASGLGAFVLFNLWNLYEVNQIVQALYNLGINPAEIYPKAAIGYTGDLSISAQTGEGAALSQQLFMALRTPMLGASGAIFGVVAAFSTLFPNAKLFFMFIPFPIKAKYLFPGIIVISLYLGFSGSMDGVAHFAHIGGAIVGFLLARSWRKHLYRFN